MNEPLNNTEDVARAIFSPLMVDEYGNILRSAFALRHNEDYISVCRMATRSWKEDMSSIPQGESRRLYGYTVLNTGQIRELSFNFANKAAVFDVVDKHTEKNLSHAGIVIMFDGSLLRGDRHLTVKPFPDDVPIDGFVLRMQTKLAVLAQKNMIKL